MTKRTRIICIAVAIAAIIAIAVTLVMNNSGGKAEQRMLLEWDFEDGWGDFAAQSYYDNASEITVQDEGGVDNTACGRVNNYATNDARLAVTVATQSQTYYRLSADVRTENVAISSSGIGANISVLGTFSYGGNITGNNDWTHIELYGVTGKDQTSITVCLRLGFYSGDNTGTAYFDNVQIEQLAEKPEGARVVSFANELNTGNQSNLTSEQKYQTQTYDEALKVGLAAIALVFLIFAMMYRYAVLRDRQKEGLCEPDALPDMGYRGLSKKSTIIVIIMLGLLLRLILSITAPQCNIDMGLFTSWGSHAVNDGITNLYVNNITSEYHIDYPPLYMYFLWFNTLLVRLFGLTGTIGQTMLIKLPSILADCAIGYMVYKLCDKRMSKNWVIFVTCLWMFNPLVLVDSAAWGQVDSLLTLPLLLMVYFITKDKYIPAGCMLALAVLLKPQGIFLIPILGFAVVRKFFRDKDRRGALIDAVKSIISFVATALIVALPFGIKMKPNIVEWLVDLYVNTANGYKGATVNSYNFFFSLGQNWVNDETTWLWGMSYFTWGMIFIVISCLIAWVLYMRARKFNAMPFMIASCMVYAVTMFGPRMHERYFFPCVGLMLVAVVLSNNKILMWLYAGISAVNFMSVLSVLMGLEVGGALQRMGAHYDVYSYYYWAEEAPHRTAITWLNIGFCIVTLLVVIAMSFDIIKIEDKRFRIWATHDDFDDTVELDDELELVELLELEQLDDTDEMDKFSEMAKFDEIEEIDEIKEEEAENTEEGQYET